MVFYAVFNSISVISLRQLTLFMSFLGFTSTRLGSEVSCQKTLLRKTQRIQCGSNLVPLDYESNTSPLSHAGTSNKRRSLFDSSFFIIFADVSTGTRYLKNIVTNEKNTRDGHFFSCHNIFQPFSLYSNNIKS